MEVIMETAYKRVLLKLSGEALAGERKNGVDAQIVGNICDKVKEVTGIELKIEQWEFKFQ